MATYNGWNNYATFRVANDILNFVTFEDSVTIEDLKEIVRNRIFDDNTLHSLATDYVNLVLNNVDWNELAEVYNTDILTAKLNING
jgi:hypothetical protein